MPTLCLPGDVTPARRPSRGSAPALSCVLEAGAMRRTEPGSNFVKQDAYYKPAEKTREG